MIILALDLGKFNTVACVFDTLTNKHYFQTLETQPEILADFICEHASDLVVVEACSLTGWVADICQLKEVKLLVASPLEDAWSWKTVKRKTDRDDALKLAKLSALGQITPVHVPKIEVRQFRSLIVFRKKIVGDITRVKNRIRSTFMSLGMPTRAKDAAWSQTGLEELAAFRKSLTKSKEDELWRGIIDLDLRHLDFLLKQLKIVSAKLKALSKEKEDVQKLMKIPGVGEVAAQTLVAWLDQPKRFRNSRAVSAYAGLTPRRYQSGNMDRSGRISKRGPKWLRSVLVEVSWIVIRYNQWASQTYERIHRGQKTRKKQAIVAVARKLLVRCWAAMRDNRVWSPPEETVVCDIERSLQ